jgi:hypothetical protein
MGSSPAVPLHVRSIKSSECTPSTSDDGTGPVVPGVREVVGGSGSSSASTNRGCRDALGLALASACAADADTAAEGSLKWSLFLVSALLEEEAIEGEVEVEEEGARGVRTACCSAAAALRLAKMRKQRRRCSRMEQSWMKGRSWNTDWSPAGHALMHTANRRQSVIWRTRMSDI